MVEEGLVDEGEVELEEDLGEGDGKDGVGQFFAILDSLLGENPWEVLLHERVEVGVALPCLEVLPLQQRKRDHHLQQSLLVVYTVLDTVKCGDALQQPPRGFLPEVRLIRSSSG